MDDKAMLIETLLYDYASTQMQHNDVSPVEAMYIAKGVYERFKDEAFHAMLSNTVNAQLAAQKEGQDADT